MVLAFRVKPKFVAASDEQSHSAALAAQLTASGFRLKAAIEHMDLGNERLQVAFDDLKDAHRELEAYAADLRALTDELVRVDGAHRQKIAQLELLTSDMSGLWTRSTWGSSSSTSTARPPLCSDRRPHASAG